MLAFLCYSSQTVMYCHITCYTVLECITVFISNKKSTSYNCTSKLYWLNVTKHQIFRGKSTVLVGFMSDEVTVLQCWLCKEIESKQPTGDTGSQCNLSETQGTQGLDPPWTEAYLTPLTFTMSGPIFWLLIPFTNTKWDDQILRCVCVYLNIL